MCAPHLYRTMHFSLTTVSHTHQFFPFSRFYCSLFPLLFADYTTPTTMLLCKYIFAARVLGRLQFFFIHTVYSDGCVYYVLASYCRFTHIQTME